MENLLDSPRNCHCQLGLCFRDIHAEGTLRDRPDARRFQFVQRVGLHADACTTRRMGDWNGARFRNVSVQVETNSNLSDHKCYNVGGIACNSIGNPCWRASVLHSRHFQPNVTSRQHNLYCFAPSWMGDRAQLDRFRMSKQNRRYCQTFPVPSPIPAHLQTGTQHVLSALDLPTLPHYECAAADSFRRVAVDSQFLRRSFRNNNLGDNFVSIRRAAVLPSGESTAQT